MLFRSNRSLLRCLFLQAGLEDDRAACTERAAAINVWISHVAGGVSRTEAADVQALRHGNDEASLVKQRRWNSPGDQQGVGYGYVSVWDVVW